MDMFEIRDEVPEDIAAREAILDAAMGPGRLLRSSERLREGRVPAAGLALVSTSWGQVVGTVRLWHVVAGVTPSLLLGPLATRPDTAGRGIGSALVRESLSRAVTFGHRSVILVGDHGYYGRFGFSAAFTAGLSMPGPFDPERLLATELDYGSLSHASGPVAAAAAEDVPALAA